MTETATTTANVLHSCNLGDVVSSLPACKRYHEVTGKKVRFLQRLNLLGSYYAGAVHPTTDSEGNQVTMNEKMFSMIKPLVEAQPYIESMEVYEGQPVDVNFDVIRGEVNVNIPWGSIQAWLFYAFHDLAYDLTKPWITLPKESHPVQEQTRGKIIVNFTERYRNHFINYFFLKQYEQDLVFAGTEKEYYLFVNTWKLDIPRLEVSDFLEYAYAIKASRFFLGNQSFGWNLTDGLRHPRVLEVCAYAQNCLPFYQDCSLGYMYQSGAEFHVKTMAEKTK